jgi:hypothetical protein
MRNHHRAVLAVLHHAHIAVGHRARAAHFAPGQISGHDHGRFDARQKQPGVNGIQIDRAAGKRRGGIRHPKFAAVAHVHRGARERGVFLDAVGDGARLRAYWWWLNGNVTKASITHDLEQMQAKGFGGAVIFDADGASQEGNDRVPHGPTFFTPAWRELYKHALREADRLGLEISLNIQSGWNLGGPVVSQDDAGKKYVWSEMKISGGTNLQIQLPQPNARENFYRDIAIVAYRLKNSAPHAPLQNWKQKALQESLRRFPRRTRRRCSRKFPPRPASRTPTRRTWWT